MLFQVSKNLELEEALAAVSLINDFGKVRQLTVLDLKAKTVRAALGLYQGKVVACGFLKRPRMFYFSELCRMARVSLPEITQEIGWFVVDPIFRQQGHANKMNSLLLPHINGPVFATSLYKGREHDLVQRFGFKFQGTFDSQLGHGKIQLLTRGLR